LSTKVARIFGVIVLENLNVSGMLKNRRLARAIAQQGWSIFRQLLEFKAVKYLRELRAIDRWEPTSQVCSSCGYRWGKLDLSVRKVKCLSCGTSHDRDINAARMFRAIGCFRHLNLLARAPSRGELRGSNSPSRLLAFKHPTSGWGIARQKHGRGADGRLP